MFARPHLTQQLLYQQRMSPPFRRMFPAIKVELYDLKPDVSYILLMDMAPVDKYRYKYNAGWVRCFEEECAPTRLYIHPDSPALGTHWTSIVINFYKLKLTNNQLDKQGHVSACMLPCMPHTAYVHSCSPDHCEQHASLPATTAHRRIRGHQQLQLGHSPDIHLSRHSVHYRHCLPE